MKKNINRFVAMKATAIETKVGVRKPSGRIISEPQDYRAVVGVGCGRSANPLLCLGPG